LLVPAHSLADLLAVALNDPTLAEGCDSVGDPAVNMSDGHFGR